MSKKVIQVDSWYILYTADIKSQETKIIKPTNKTNVKRELSLYLHSRAWVEINKLN